MGQTLTLNLILSWVYICANGRAFILLWEQSLLYLIWYYLINYHLRYCFSLFRVTALILVLTTYLTKAIYGREGLVWLTVWRSRVRHGGKGVVVEECEATGHIASLFREQRATDHVLWSLSHSVQAWNHGTCYLRLAWSSLSMNLVYKTVCPEVFSWWF